MKKPAGRYFEEMFEIDLPPAQKWLLFAIASHGDTPYPSVARLARMTSLARSTVQATRLQLRALGILTWLPGEGKLARCSIYTIHWGQIPTLEPLEKSANLKAELAEAHALIATLQKAFPYSIDPARPPVHDPARPPAPTRPDPDAHPARPPARPGPATGTELTTELKQLNLRENLSDSERTTLHWLAIYEAKKTEFLERAPALQVEALSVWEQATLPTIPMNPVMPSMFYRELVGRLEVWVSFQQQQPQTQRRKLQ